MRIAMGAAAAGVALALAGAARAEPQVIVKCDGPLTDAMRFTHDTGWKPFPNPDAGVTITRDKGRFGIEVKGEDSYSSSAVLPMPLQNPKSFKVLRGTGNELFHLEKGDGGKPVLKHTIRGGRDGSHVYNIREMILANCSVVAPDVVVSEPGAADTGG
ncbi:hypothetical protein [Phenylobacterium sp.]|uniref:hypothetical protein n=1 Tax=Phenylobacterium sp. TaxID=1871053 RepID=UPI0011FC7832|nr:hypothetical protein [Phenylobacterium sp.]THD58648.1 MAG: hypothetical protein E8A49_19210 [Phenylobacterium sp.]